MSETWLEREVTERAKVLHISESFAGGVSAAVRDYVRATPEFEHHLLYAPRDDAPLNPGDLHDFVSVTELPSGHIRRIREVRRIARSLPRVIVHAHSSYAGVYARAGMKSSRTRPIIYTPHCYGFERRDFNRAIRGIVWIIEAVLSTNTAAFATCSRRELALSQWRFTRARSIFVPNVAPHGIERAPRVTSRQMRVVGAGRLGKQKDPLFFADCVRSLRAAGVEGDFVWIGGGGPRLTAHLIEAGVRLTGWLERTEALRSMAEADLYIHSARWEGFPIAVLEAAELGVAVAVRDIPAFDGVNLPVKITRPEDLVTMWDQLEREDFRYDMVAATEVALRENSIPALRSALLEIYSGSTRHLSEVAN